MSSYSEIAELYTPLTKALEELKRRRGDRELRKRVDAYFSSHPCPPELMLEPRAVMSPTLVSPNLELNYFLDVSKNLPIRPIFYEFRKDKFVHLNYVKHCLGELTFFRENFLGNKKITESIRIIDFEKDQGKPMNEIKTIKGENFIDFHHRLFSECLPGVNIEIYDFSDWFRKGYSFAPELPYLRYLGLFISDAILFGNFTTEKRESFFTNIKVLPAFRKLKEVFGLQPLIVPIEPMETDDGPLGCYYPEKVRQFV